ncbi:MAG: LD-carboxypeptidase [Myxococcota bacterium]|nr:LD-carboxypeptidase [Myxococcota bacterium]
MWPDDWLRAARSGGCRGHRAPPLSSPGGDVHKAMIQLVTIAIPPALVPGDMIAVVAPSGPLARDDLWRGLAWLRIRYPMRIRPGVLARRGYLAGDDALRSRELANAILDDDVKAILAARGGYGAMRILDGVPWEALARRPKWIVGFSDVTALHMMASRVGVASVHASDAAGLGRDQAVSIRAAWLASLERPRSERVWRALRVIRAGTATGPIVGGNLALVHAMAAAGRLTIPRGAVVALEDVGEAPYRIDRMLTSLILGGYFMNASAIVFGRFHRCDSGVDGVTVDEVLDSCTRPLGIPVLAGAPFGHGARNEAFVLGAAVRVRGDAVTWCSESDSPSW